MVRIRPSNPSGGWITLSSILLAGKVAWMLRWLLKSTPSIPYSHVLSPLSIHVGDPLTGIASGFRRDLICNRPLSGVTTLRGSSAQNGDTLPKKATPIAYSHAIWILTPIFRCLWTFSCHLFRAQKPTQA